MADRSRRKNLIESVMFFALDGAPVAKSHAASKPPHACLNDLVLQALACGWSKEQAGSDLSCRSLVTQDVLDYCCGVGGYVGLGGDGLTGDLDGDLA